MNSSNQNTVVTILKLVEMLRDVEASLVGSLDEYRSCCLVAAAASLEVLVGILGERLTETTSTCVGLPNEPLTCTEAWDLLPQLMTAIKRSFEEDGNSISGDVYARVTTFAMLLREADMP